MRPEPHEEGQRWLDQARADLASAATVFAGGHFYLVCFLAQQIAEKALKGYLYASGEAIVVGHSVEKLGRRVLERDEGVSETVTRAAELDAYYVPTRYPNGLPDSIPARVFGKDTAERALRLATEVVETIEQHWPPREARS